MYNTPRVFFFLSPRPRTNSRVARRAMSVAPKLHSTRVSPPRVSLAPAKSVSIRFRRCFCSAKFAASKRRPAFLRDLYHRPLSSRHVLAGVSGSPLRREGCSADGSRVMRCQTAPRSRLHRDSRQTFQRENRRRRPTDREDFPDFTAGKRRPGLVFVGEAHNYKKRGSTDE